jgi:dCTP deaminase
MSFWTSEHIAQAGNRLVNPFNPLSVQNCAYELHVGNEGYVTGGEVGRKTVFTAERPQIIISPGQFALLLTQETVRIPMDAIGFISMRYGYKISGLVNVSGFHVDPGFSGYLVFGLYNAGGSEVILSRGEPVFLLWVASLEGTTRDTYRGTHGGGTLSNGDIMKLGRTAFAPSSLEGRLHRLEVWVDVAQRLVIAILIAASLAVGGLLVRTLSDRQGPSVPVPTEQTTISPSPTRAESGP